MEVKCFIRSANSQFALASLTVGLAGKIVIGVAAVWCLQFVFLGNEMYYTQHLTHQADRDTANRIVNRIDNLAGEEQLPYPIPVTLVGKYEPPSFGQKKFSVLGASVFEWDQGNIYRQMALLNLMYVSGIQLAVDKGVTQKIDAYILENEIPGWPREGSVFVFDDNLVVVNLGSRAYSGANLKMPVQKMLEWLL